MSPNREGGSKGQTRSQDTGLAVLVRKVLSPSFGSLFQPGLGIVRFSVNEKDEASSGGPFPFDTDECLHSPFGWSLEVFFCQEGLAPWPKEAFGFRSGLSGCSPAGGLFPPAKERSELWSSSCANKKDGF